MVCVRSWQALQTVTFFVDTAAEAKRVVFTENHIFTV